MQTLCSCVTSSNKITWTKLHMKYIIFWNMTPCSPMSVNRRFGGTYRLHLQGRRNKFSKIPACLLIFAKLISSTLKMEAICYSVTSVDTQRTTRRYIPEDDTLHNHPCENLKSYMVHGFEDHFRSQLQVTPSSYVSASHTLLPIVLLTSLF
jgi:hypothetical protein